MKTKSENLDESDTKDLVKNLPKRDTVPFSFRMDRELKHEVDWGKEGTQYAIFI